MTMVDSFYAMRPAPLSIGARKALRLPRKIYSYAFSTATAFCSADNV